MTTTAPARPRLALRPGVVRPLLAVDAAGCLALGATGLLAAGALDAVLGVPAALLVVTGLALLGYAVEAALVARRPSRGGLLGLAAVNAVFAAGALALLVAGSLTGWGTVVAVALTGVSVAVADVLVLGARDGSVDGPAA
jgi:hypothetical protein